MKIGNVKLSGRRPKHLKYRRFVKETVGVLNDGRTMTVWVFTIPIFRRTLTFETFHK